MVKRVDSIESPQDNKKSLPKRVMEKKERIPLHKSKRLKVVDFCQDQDYYYRTFTDKDGRIERAKQAGYEFIEAPPERRSGNAQDPSRYGEVVCQSVGNGEVGYTMRIPREWREEDEKSKQKELDEKDVRMGRDRLPPEARHLYRGGVKIDRSDS